MKLAAPPVERLSSQLSGGEAGEAHQLDGADLRGTSGDDDFERSGLRSWRGGRAELRAQELIALGCRHFSDARLAGL